MLRLIAAGIAALGGIAWFTGAVVPVAGILVSSGLTLALVVRLRWHATAGGAIAMGIATHLVGWGLSVQNGGRVEWGAIFFVVTTVQLRYESAAAVLPSIAFYIAQHTAQFCLLRAGVSLDFIWDGAYQVVPSILAVSLAVLQGSVVIEISRALNRRHEAMLTATTELADRAAHDVSERIKAAEAINDMRQQLHDAIEAIGSGFALFDADDCLIQVNSAYRSYYPKISEFFTPGTSYREIARAYLIAFPEYASGVDLEAAVETWVAARVERTNTKEFNLGDRWLLLQDRPTASGGRVSMRTDISHLKQIQRDLEEARMKAEAANTAKSEFLARMSHELRTPLNSIIGFSRLVKSNKQGTLSSKDIMYLDRVSTNGQHLLALINDILDLSRIEAGKMPIIIEDIDCNALVFETIKMLEGQTINDGVRLVTLASPRHLNLSTDAAKLKQILINLIGNALKFTATGSVTVSVEHAEDQRDVVVFAVCDTGAGIPAERLQAIFEAFEQADGTTTRQYGGTGLGLTICRTLCSLINATLTVESEVGVGSTFRVTCAPMNRRPTPLSRSTLSNQLVTA